MTEIYKTKASNKHMLHRREAFIGECERMNKRKAAREGYKPAAGYFPLTYNSRNELRKTGHACRCSNRTCLTYQIACINGHIAAGSLFEVGESIAGNTLHSGKNIVDDKRVADTLVWYKQHHQIGNGCISVLGPSNV